MGAGFKEAELDDLRENVLQNIEKLFSVNWFKANKHLFNIWMVNTGFSGQSKKSDKKQFFKKAAITPYDVLIIIHNRDGQEVAKANHIELFKYSKNYTVLAHELGHMLGHLCDEYFNSKVHRCKGLAKRCPNLHDKPSNEKWVDILDRPPVEGGRYCKKGVWRSGDKTIMRDSAHGLYFDAVGLKAMDLGAGKMIGTIEKKRPRLTVSGVDKLNRESKTLRARALTSDESGIDRVEFYFSREGQTSKSVKIDRELPYEADIDISDLAPGIYYLDTLSYDRNWNYQRVTRKFKLPGEKNAAVNPIKIPILIKEEVLKSGKGVNRKRAPVTLGIPLPENSNIKGVNQLAVENVDRYQLRVLDRWPNKNIKWVLADFQADIRAGRRKEDAVLKTVVKKNGSGWKKLAKEENDKILVDTGAAQFRIKKSKFNFFDSVRVGGRELIDTTLAGGIVSSSPGNGTFSSSNDVNALVQIEENGPVRAVVKVEGALRDGNQEEKLWFLTRMYFYKNKTWVRAFVTIKNADPSSVSPISIRHIGVKIPLKAEKNIRFAFGTNKGKIEGQLSSDKDNAFLFQSYSKDHETEGPRDDLFTFEECKEKMFDFQAPGLLVGHNKKAINTLGNSREWSLGWMDVSDRSGNGMIMGMKWMSGFWPAGFDVTGKGEASLDIFSRHARYASDRALKFACMTHETRELIFYFYTGPKTAPEKIMKEIEAPLMARINVEDYNRSRAIFDIETLISLKEENEWRGKNNLKSRRQCNREKGVNVWRRYWYSGVKSTDYAYKYMMNYLRTGCPRDFLFAQQLVNFNSDYSVYRSDGGTYGEFWERMRGLWAKNKSLFQVGRFDRLHNHWLAMPVYYWTTGDERIKEAILDYEEKYLARGAQNWSVTADMRGLARELRTLAYLYYFSGNSQIKKIFLKSMDSLLDARDKPGQWKKAGWNMERGYMWQAHHIKHNPHRKVCDFYTVQIFADALWCARQVLKNDTYPRMEDLEDLLSGLGSFIFNELLQRDGEKFGYLYDYWLDQPNTVGDENHPDDGSWRIYSKRDSSRIFAFKYEETGDPVYLETGEKFLRAGAGSDTNPPRFHLIHNSLYPPNTRWEYLEDLTVQRKSPDEVVLSWQVPANCVEYRLKFSDKPIVEWLGYDQKQKTFAFDPKRFTPFFAAFNSGIQPEALPQGKQLSMLLDMGQLIRDYNSKRGYAPGHPLYLTYNKNTDYYFKLKYKVQVP